MMIPNENAIHLFRFDEEQWICKFIGGKLSFGCAGKWIKKAIDTYNEVQGDRFEGIFARLKNNDTKIDYYRKQLGSDLEVFTDAQFDGYTFLRRHSTKLKPVFCFYAITAYDLIKKANEQCPDLLPGKVDIKYNFDERLFVGFTNNPTIAAVQPEPFIKNAKEALEKHTYGYKMNNVDYDEFKNLTFDVGVTDDYDELFYKTPSYCYQHEGRIILRGVSFQNIEERLTVHYEPLLQKDRNVVKKIYLGFDGVQIEGRK